ncbi:hypothetical protein ACSBM8_11760 [Sphingomonas sp. ASY06-1R]|uniref:hypothetical protein n=1 Tax=Sphingomonas sp. ASY06-1R TaxID=3445771 RepID=UPI003FA2C725
MMNGATSSRWKVTALNVRALAAGLITGALLVAAYTFASGLIAARTSYGSGAELFIPIKVQIGLAIWFSGIYGTIIVAICAPIWLLFRKIGYTSGVLALILGFTAPVTLWIAININGNWSLLDLAKGGLPYGFSGSGAGLVAWLCRPRGIGVLTNPAMPI